jgi:hypothetical protein
MEIAKNIKNQMGGRRLEIMIGAYNFVAETDGNYLRFRFKGSRKYNMVTITLNALDTYDIEFQKYSPSKFTVTTVDVFAGAYADMLIDVFEDATGLYLSI